MPNLIIIQAHCRIVIVCPKESFKRCLTSIWPALGAQWQIMHVVIEYNLISGLLN